MIMIVIAVAVMVAHHVINGYLVTTAETFAVCFALFVRKVRMAILLPVFNVGTTVIIEVLASCFDAFLETLPAEFVEFIWRSVPRALGRTHAPVVCAS